MWDYLFSAFDNIKKTLNGAIVKFLIEIFLIMSLAVVVIYYFNKFVHDITPKPTETNSVVATPSLIVKDEPLAQVKIKTPIKVFKRSQKIKEKSKMPEAIVNNNNEKVIASISIPKDDMFPKTVTTILNVDTGITTSFIKDEPLPFLSLNRHGDIGLYYGIKNGYSAVRLQANQGIIDIKEIHVKAIGSIDQLTNGQTDYFVGVGASYNW